MENFSFSTQLAVWLDEDKSRYIVIFYSHFKFFILISKEQWPFFLR